MGDIIKSERVSELQEKLKLWDNDCIIMGEMRDGSILLYSAYMQFKIIDTFSEFLVSYEASNEWVSGSSIVGAISNWLEEKDILGEEID